MKTKYLYSIAILLMAIAAASCRTGLTVAQGPVIWEDSTMAEPYFALIKNEEHVDCEEWMRWEPWEMQDMYHIAAAPGKKVEVMWLAKCDFDTLAQLTLVGVRGKQKIHQDTLVLDGSHYYKGIKYEKR